MKKLFLPLLAIAFVLTAVACADSTAATDGTSLPSYAETTVPSTTAAPTAATTVPPTTEETVPPTMPPTEPSTEPPTAAATEPATEATEDNRRDYILNMNTLKFHYPGCTSVAKINPENRYDFHGTREQILEMGYTPCKICNP